MGKTLFLLIIGIIIGAAGLYGYQNPEIGSQASEFVSGILKSASVAPAPAPTHTPTVALVVALSPTVAPTEVVTTRAEPVSTVTPTPTGTPKPKPTVTATLVPSPTPIPASYAIEVLSIESLGGEYVDFLLEVRNVGELESDEVAQVEMSVDGGISELVNIIGALSAGESKAFAYARTLSPGSHTVRFSVGDSVSVVGVNVEADGNVISSPTPTPTVTQIPEPTDTPTTVPTPLPMATETPMPTVMPTLTPTQEPVPPTRTPTHTPVPPSPTHTPESEGLVSKLFKSAKDLSEASDSSQPDLDVGELEALVHSQINQERVKRGLATLMWDMEIAVIARNHSVDMGSENYFSHTNPSGQNATDRGASAGYDCIKHCGSHYTFGLAENIHQGWLYSSITTINGVDFYNWLSQGDIAAKAVNGWMKSQGHRENILKDTYDRTGIGIAITPEGKVFITQNFC